MTLCGLHAQLSRTSNIAAYYNVCLPSANGIELIELGGMTPTSVTTVVMLVGGVKS